MNRIRQLFCLFFLGLLLASAFSVASAGTLHQQSTGGSDCFISTTSAKTVSVRVGPGENRTPVAFLQVDKQFEVLGRYVAADESVWYQIDPKLAAPKKAIKEAWVAAGAKVDESGDCEAVPDADAPPIIPITVRPTAAPAGSGESAPPSDTGAGSTAGTIALRSGTWTLSFSRQSNGSCEGTPNFILNTNEVWSDFDESDYVRQGELSVVIVGSTFIYDGDLFLSTGVNRYVGSWTFADGRNTQLYLTVVAPTSMVGQMIGNARFDGRACSVTTDLTITRNG